MWRLRTLIRSEIVIETGEFSTPQVEFKIFDVNKQNTENGENFPPTIRYCDVYLLDTQEDIFEAFAFLYDEVNNFLDRVSFTSYGWANILQILSIAPNKVAPNEEFDMALPQVDIYRKTINLNLINTKNEININFAQQRWLRLLRLGLNAYSEEEKFISYYSLLEEIAREESNEFILNICKKCGTQVNTGRKATNNFIKDLMKKHGMKQELVDKAPEIRNKIAHGGAKKDKLYLSYVREINSHMEEICLLELESRLKINVINRLNAHITDVPMVKHRCVYIENGSFNFIRTTQNIPARFVELKHEIKSLSENQFVEIGIPLDKNRAPIISPFALPEVLL